MGAVSHSFSYVIFAITPVCANKSSIYFASDHHIPAPALPSLPLSKGRFPRKLHVAKPLHASFILDSMTLDHQDKHCSLWVEGMM